MIVNLSLVSYAQIPSVTLLNETVTYNGPSNSSIIFNATGIRVNADLSTSPRHSFESQSDLDSANVVVVYNSSNSTGYLLKLLIDDESPQFGDPAVNDAISHVNCQSNALTQLCTGGCGGFDFNSFNNFTVKFFSNNNTFDILIGQSTTVRATGQVCGGVAGINNIIFAVDAWSGSGTGYIVKNSILTADNRPPLLIGTVYNITTPEETSAIINISGNFTDLDGQNLTFGFDESGIENITIAVNSTTGIANITPDINFFGIRYVKFFANDSMNITFSNNVTINVTNVNDLPSVSEIMLNNTDFLNRTNGSLTAGWAFNDVDSDLPQGNETKWYRNGTEAVNIANLSSISRGNTTRGETWIFSIRAFDGAAWSAWANSSQITIRNAAPLFNPELQNLSSEKLDRLFYDINYTELDNDSIAFYLNTTEFPISGAGIINFTFLSYGNRTINITIGDSSLNTSHAILIEITDTSPPKITSISASSSGSSPVGIDLSVTTDENAVCRYSTSDLNYSEMQAMSSTSLTSHSNSVSYSSDSSGRYYVRCNDTLGFVMNFSNSTVFSADVQVSSEPAAAPSSSGGSGGWQCRYRWECYQWSECIEGKQKRDCRIEKVVPFYSETKCEYLEEASTEKECKPPEEKQEVKEAAANAEAMNIGAAVDAAGKGESKIPTGGVILDVRGGSKKAFGVASLALLVSSILLYAKFSHPRLFRRKSQLSGEEMQKLKELMGKYEKP